MKRYSVTPLLLLFIHYVINAPCWWNSVANQKEYITTFTFDVWHYIWSLCRTWMEAQPHMWRLCHTGLNRLRRAEHSFSFRVLRLSTFCISQQVLFKITRKLFEKSLKQLMTPFSLITKNNDSWLMHHFWWSPPYYNYNTIFWSVHSELLHSNNVYENECIGNFCSSHVKAFGNEHLYYPH